MGFNSGFKGLSIGFNKLKNGECHTNCTQEQSVLLCNFLVRRPDAFMLKVVALETKTKTFNVLSRNNQQDATL